MAVYGRPTLRDTFDDAPTPHIAHPPNSHRRDFYVATDGSFVSDGGGLGVIIETWDGERLLRLAIPDDAPDNNVAEYRALHLGLDALAAHAPDRATVGVLVDHNDLAGNINATVIGSRGPEWREPFPVSVPSGTKYQWRGIEARLSRFGDVRAACIDSNINPAHVLANAPEQYAHVNEQPGRCLLPEKTTADQQIPPPSRADRHAGD
ncbi:MAG: ribonuclease H [Halobacteriales archaeon]|nr:ribonuclease H [Halobacteriales archaeon]